MNITTFTLHNIGPFADVTIKMPPPRDGGQFLALVGEGKTSALRGAALAVAGPNVTAPCESYVRHTILRDGEHSADASAKIDGATYVTSLMLDHGHASPVQRLGWFGGFYAAYGIDRVRNDGRADGTLLEIDSRNGWRRIGSLFDETICVMRARDVLVEIQRNKLLRHEWSGESGCRALRSGDAYAATCRALSSVLDAAEVRMGMRNVEVDGVPLPRLGDGTNALAAWVADLCGRWITREVMAGRTVSAAFPEEMEGVCIIDGFDSHVHPSAQTELVERVRATFPRMTFIVGVDSPLTLSSLRRDEAVVLQRDENGTIGAHHSVSEPRLRTGSELLSRFFGVRDVFPSRYGKAWHRYGTIAGNPYRDDDEEAEMQAARSMLDRAGLSPDFEPVPRVTQ